MVPEILKEEILVVPGKFSPYIFRLYSSGVFQVNIQENMFLQNCDILFTLHLKYSSLMSSRRDKTSLIRDLLGNDVILKVSLLTEIYHHFKRLIECYLLL